LLGQRRRRSPQAAAVNAQGQPGAPVGAPRVDGIFLSDFEQGEIGPDLFRHACLMGLEGMVSKHRESLYRGGRSDRWVKVKNRQHPAFARVQDRF
jgi:bifunctional non-homologous end joining protein LigD